MNFNLSSILTNSLRFLNITKRAIPLIKDLNPTIKTIKTKINEYKKDNKPEKKELAYKDKPVQNNNSLTFFK